MASAVVSESFCRCRGRIGWHNAVGNMWLLEDEAVSYQEQEEG